MEQIDFVEIINEMDSFLNEKSKKKTFVSTDHIYDRDKIDLIRGISKKYNPQSVFDCFQRMERGQRFVVKLPCEDCACDVIKKFPKQKFFDEIAKGKIDTFLCDDCKKKRLEVHSVEQSIEDEKRKQRIIESTNSFIEIYLSPTRTWNDGISQKERFDILWRESIFINRDEVADHIQQMSYEYFLSTPYWKAIAFKVKSIAKLRCQVCNDKESLNAHHRTYDNHGYELYHLADLTTLCRSCHETHHILVGELS